MSFQSLMHVCDLPGGEGCSYHPSVLWPETDGVAQGLYSPAFGPEALGPMAITQPFDAGACAAPFGGVCSVEMSGGVGARPEHKLWHMGAYCGVFGALLHGTVRGPAIDLVFSLEWAMPEGRVIGTAYDTLRPGISRVHGWMAVRAAPGGGDCGATTPTTRAFVHGVLTFS